MPKALAIDDDEVRTTRRPRRSAAPPPEEPGRGSRWLSLALASPKDTVAIAVASAAVIAIVVNAVFLQAGRHPSPMFAPAVKPVASAPAAVVASSPAAAPAPVAPATVASVSQSSPLPRPRPVEAQAAPAAPVAKPAVPARPSDPLAGLINASQRVAAVQRALTDYGYGQIRPTGTIGPETQAAIQRFERERKMPITGQLSDRLVRELGLATGRSIE